MATGIAAALRRTDVYPACIRQRSPALQRSVDGGLAADSAHSSRPPQSFAAGACCVNPLGPGIRSLTARGSWGCRWRARALTARRYALLAETMPPPASRQSLVALMRGAPEDVRTLTRCCELMSQIPMPELADGADAVVTVVAAVRFLTKSGPHSLPHAAYALAVLACASTANRQTAASAGALDAVVAAMRMAAGDALLQFYGCSAIGQLSEGGHGLRADGAAEAALGAVMAAYRAHPKDADVLLETQGVIRCIIAEGAIYKAAAAAAGAIEMLIAQIHTHTRNGDDDALHKCFYVLGHLYDVTGDCNRRRMLAVESIQLVVAVMVARSDVVCMQRQGCFALSNIARYAPDHEMIRTGALSAAVKALLQYESDLRVQQNACGVLEAACENASADTAAAAVALGAIGGVIRALRAHPDHEEVQRAACGALCGLIIHLENEMAHVAGLDAAIEPLIAAIRAYPANPFLQRHGCTALAHFIWQRVAPTQRAVEAGAIEAVLAGMIAISDAASLAVDVHSPSNYQASCDALDSLLRLSTATELRAVCAVAAIEEVIVPTRGLWSEHPYDVRVCSAVLLRIQAAVLRHDGGRCNDTGCKRCAAARERGALCALPGCGARLRQNRKKLKRCGRCLVAAYCGEAHQRDHWPTHRPLCDPAAPAADADASAGAADASSAMERLNI